MRDIVKNAIYKHFKGDYYIVLDVAKHSETNEEHVIYRALYGNNELYIRALNMFLSEVEQKKISQGYTKISFWTSDYW